MFNTRLSHRPRLCVGLLSGLMIALCPGKSAVCSAQQTNGRSSAVQSNDSKNAGASNALVGLPRLRIPVTLTRQRIKMDDLLKDLSDSVGVPLHIAGNEIPNVYIAVRWQHLLLRDALDGLAHVGAWEWVRDGNRELLLRARYNPRGFDAYRPRTQAQADEQRAGREFMKQFAGLPADMQRELQADRSLSSGPRGIPFSDLPSDVKQTLRDGFAAYQQHTMELMHRDTFLGPADIEGSHVYVTQSHCAEFDSATIDFDGHSASGDAAGASFQGKVFNDQRDQHYEMVARKPGENPGQSHPERDDPALRRDALQSDPRMKLKVSLSETSKLTLYEALKSVAAQVQEQAPDKPLPFVADSRDRSDTRRAPNLRGVPLGDALDKLCKLYTFNLYGRPFVYSWGALNSGVIVFHTVAQPVEGDNRESFKSYDSQSGITATVYRD